MEENKFVPLPKRLEEIQKEVSDLSDKIDRISGVIINMLNDIKSSIDNK